MLARTQPRPVGDPGPGRAGPRAQPGGVGHQLLGLRGQLVEVGAERVVVVRVGERVAAAGPDGDPLGEVPVDRIAHAVSPRARLLVLELAGPRDGYFGRTTLFR